MRLSNRVWGLFITNQEALRFLQSVQWEDQVMRLDVEDFEAATDGVRSGVVSVPADAGISTSRRFSLTGERPQLAHAVQHWSYAWRARL